MMTDKKSLLVGVSIILLTMSTAVSPLYAQERMGSSTNFRNRTPLIIGLEYLKPTEEDRQLRTRNFDLLFPMATFEPMRMTLYAGLTATRVTGEITQLIGSLPAGTLQQVTYESSATGFGPTVLAKFDLFELESLSGALDAAGAFAYYDRDFPAGGSRYNFMWRIGPVLAYAVGKSSTIGISYRWLHVSNGEGVGPENPSYNAKGIGTQFSHVF